MNAVDRAIVGAAGATVVGLAGVAGAISYSHMAELARIHGEIGWRSQAFPVSVDGIEVVASLVLLAHRRAGTRAGWLRHSLAIVSSTDGSVLGGTRCRACTAFGCVEPHSPIGGSICTTAVQLSRRPRDGGPTVSTPTSGHSRRAVLGALTVAAIGTPIALGQPWVHAASTVAPAPDGAAWHPDPAKDRLKAFEGIEANRAHLHPGREYVVVEDDHWRFSISTDDRDSTGGGDRQRTEAKGMVTGGKPVKIRDGETWRIAYEMFVPASMHGTDRFTHIFQAKTPKNNGGPWVTLSLSRSGGAELI